MNAPVVPQNPIASEPVARRLATHVVSVSHVRLPVRHAPVLRRPATLFAAVVVLAALLLSPGRPAWLVPGTVILAGLLALLSNAFGGALRRSRSRLPTVRDLSLDADGCVRLFTADDKVHPATVRFAWVGSHRARIIAGAASGAALELFVERGDVSATQWRRLCAWFVWLDRQRAHRSAGYVNQPEG